ncbi:YopT-type cysteine protease domain-containing protein [Psychromonas sp. Urea-02u-13]|uniref:YopT-type cysteine protease domain-containing protein n=1 Tax=Psychromonas sp. Urea-02u-13 TaxID=2058326 RepID=UPI000C32811A|nr:YopT-type cysteine protease domain-containing protein [Psychromonas sp. Urea-02u-13]PKG38785.1 hypothetical protein CXF74_11850 [Psychromonas sp. Urea-02u-13]
MSIRALAEEHGGKRTNKFNQSKGLSQNWRHLIPESQGGVCGGLSLMWLSSRKSGLTQNVFEKRYAEPLFKYAERASQLGANNCLGGHQGIDNVANTLGLNKGSAKVTVSNTGMPKWIVKGPSKYVFIAVNGHAVAAEISGKVVNFFDPNYGQFKFPDTLKFVLFMQDYLTITNQTAAFLKFYR